MDHEKKFKKEMAIKMRKGEFGSLMQAPFIARSTSHDTFKKYKGMGE